MSAQEILALRSELRTVYADLRASQERVAALEADAKRMTTLESLRKHSRLALVDGHGVDVHYPWEWRTFASFREAADAEIARCDAQTDAASTPTDRPDNAL